MAQNKQDQAAAQQWLERQQAYDEIKRKENADLRRDIRTENVPGARLDSRARAKARMNAYKAGGYVSRSAQPRKSSRK